MTVFALDSFGSVQAAEGAIVNTVMNCLVS
jgi:hypothetical protein